MGCDIHLIVEKKVDGKWERAERFVPNPYLSSYWNFCGECGQHICEVRDPYEMLGVPGRTATDEEVADLWVKATAESNGRLLAGVSDTYDNQAELAAINIAYEAIKTEGLRLLAPKGGLPRGGLLRDGHPIEGIYHVDAHARNCEGTQDWAIRPPQEVRDSYYSGRNYQLFGLLNDVRGVPPESGQIGTDGVPEDLSEEGLKKWEGWGIDGHSPAYATLADFAKHDWWGQHEIFTFKVWMKDAAKDEDREEREREAKNLTYRIEMLKDLWDTMSMLRDSEHVKAFSIYSQDTEWPDADSECVWDNTAQALDEKPAITTTLHAAHGDGKYQDVIKMMAKMLSHVEGGDLDSVRAFWWYDN